MPPAAPPSGPSGSNATRPPIPPGSPPSPPPSQISNSWKAPSSTCFSLPSSLPLPRPAPPEKLLPSLPMPPRRHRVLRRKTLPPGRRPRPRRWPLAPPPRQARPAVPVLFCRHRQSRPPPPRRESPELPSNFRRHSLGRSPPPPRRSLLDSPLCRQETAQRLKTRGMRRKKKPMARPAASAPRNPSASCSPMDAASSQDRSSLPPARPSAAKSGSATAAFPAEETPVPPSNSPKRLKKPFLP